ncbi:MAG: acetylneuraminic acid synthetase, partial [Nocardioides sp.]|nr:acetylneuraminic acid synthetase [Nocardioides sp.]
MIIERNLTAYVVFSEDPVSRALEKITANKARVIFLVSQHGELQGALSDGDFRRWVSTQSEVDLSVPAIRAANTAVRSAPDTAPPAEVQALFAPGVDLVPLVDARRHLTGIAINRSDQLRIGRHLVGADAPAVLISEIGINHQGSIDFAKELVDLSADAGADIVKFQLRDMDALYRQGSGASGGEDLGPQYTLDLLAKYNLTADQLFEVFDHCRAVGVEVMCTPWDAPSVDRLAEYGVPALKFASADLTNHALIRHAVGKSMPLVLSTGMSTEVEIQETVSLLRSLGASYAMLHCQSTYPAPFKDVNLRYLERLAEIAQCPVGYSGHERGFHVPLGAVALGAKIIEKHFTTDRSMEGNDHKVSLLPEEFREMVRRVRELEEALGSAAPRAVSTGEMMNRVNLAKSLVAARRIEAGEVISASAIDIKSPGRGLQPNAYDDLLGRTASRGLDAGDFFYATDLGEGTPKGRQYDFSRPWGLAVRYHDIAAMTRDCTPDFLEFHFSYKDLEIDPATVFPTPLEMSFTTHSPDLFAGDFILNLASEDDDHWERSIVELQRVVDLTRSMRQYFTRCDEDPVIIASLGGFTKDAFVTADELAPMYARVAAGLDRIDDSGVRLCAQTLPPYPWYMGGQLYCNLFVNPVDTAAFAEKYDRRLCLDVSHSKLAANFVGMPFSEAVELLAPHAEHLHLVDAT